MSNESIKKSPAAKPVDRRVKRTKARLRHCLAELLRKKRIQDITVKELADMADINRGTFYLHYSDVFDLLEKTEDEILDDFNQTLEKYDPTSVKRQPSPLFKEIFELAKDNSDIIEILLGENGDISFLNKLKEILRKHCLSFFVEGIKKKEPVYFDFYYNYIANGCIGIVQHWMRSGFSESPEELAEITEKIVKEGIAAFDAGQQE